MHPHHPFALLASLAVVACTAAPVVPNGDFAWSGTATWESHFERPHATRTIDATVLLRRDGAHAQCELIERWSAAAKPVRTVFVRGVGEEDDGARFVDLLLAATDGAPAGTHTIVFQHPRLGDVEDRVSWQPGELRLAWHRPHDAVELVLHPIVPPATGITAAAPVAPRAAADSAPARFATLAPGVHELVLPDADSRALAIEFADHVVLCETSIDNRAGERLLAALDEHLPGKPVRYVLFGHYHPHYTGGLRPVMARGATIVAPPLGAAFAREIAARPFRCPPDALAASGRTPSVEAFTDRRVFRDDTNEVVAIDIGADSRHTDEYVVFHLPRQRLLFEGDLGWFGVGSGMRSGGDRARGLLKAIDDRGLDVATVVQSWPATGRAALPLAELRALVGQ